MIQKWPSSARLYEGVLASLESEKKNLIAGRKSAPQKLAEVKAAVDKFNEEIFNSYERLNATLEKLSKGTKQPESSTAKPPPQEDEHNVHVGWTWTERQVGIRD